MRDARTWTAAIIAAAFLAGCASQTGQAPAMTWNTLSGDAPLVIAHRGASGYRPEHTLEAYTLAIAMGADVIEPDLVFTKDGVLVARHDRYLSTTTNIEAHPEFAARKRANNDAADPDPAYRAREDWWVEDFTLAELKTLRAVQPFPGRSKEFDGLYEIPTFEEVLALATAEAAKAGRKVGVYPETKHPGFFAAIGHDFEAPLLAALEGFDAGPVFIQSFEPEILKRLKGKTDAKLVQLVYEATPGAGPNISLAEIATYADGVGAAKVLFLRSWDEHWFPLLSDDAHDAGLFVHYWTFRDDAPNVDLIRLAQMGKLGGRLDQCEDVIIEPLGCADPDQVLVSAEEAARPEFELKFYFGLSDGVFTDFPDTAVRVREMISHPAHPGESRDPD